MKLEYGDQTLGDDAVGDFIEDEGGAHQRVVQQEPLAGGATVFTAAKGNRSNQRSFSVAKEHATLDAAVKWFNQHADELAESAVLRITHGASFSEMADAVLQSVDRVELTGKSTRLRYTFTGGQIVEAA